MEFRQMNKVFFVFLAMALLLIAGCSQSTGNNSSPELKPRPINNPTSDNTEVTDDVEVVEDEGSINSGSSEVKTFKLTGQNFKFLMDGQENPVLLVSKGDRVRIEFTSTEGFHDWKVDEFGAATEKVKDGESTFVEFVADKTGTFEYYCSVGSHRANGMKGQIIVN